MKVIAPLSSSKHFRLSLFYDVDDWAFHNVAQNIKRVSQSPYETTTFSRQDWFGLPGKSDSILSNSDIVVFLWRFDCLAFLDSLSDAGWRQLMAPKRCAIVVLVYDHVYREKSDLKALGNPFDVADCVAASSRRLCKLYNETPHLPDITHCVPDGVDTEQFRPTTSESPTSRQPLRIAWVGNSDWGITLGHDFKGKRAIFEPALEILRQSKLPFTTHVADKAGRLVPHHLMPEFYRNIDVLVCCSLSEGTPNPILEAMASGCAIVSTDVGIVPEVFGPRQMQFLLPERSPRALADLLAHLIRDPDTLNALRQENLQRRATLDWQTRWPAWQALFDQAQNNVHAVPETGIALASFRFRRKSRIARVRKLIVTNRFAYNAYTLILAKSPALVRLGKRVLSGGGS